MQFLTYFIFLVLFSEKLASIDEDNPSEKFVTAEEELDGIDIDDIGNLEDSPRLVFIEEERANLNDGGELTRNINQKKKSGILQWFIDIHYLKNAAGERISSITLCNIVNQLDKRDFSCVSVVSNLKDRYFFLIKWVEIALNQFLLGATGTGPI